MRQVLRWGAVVQHSEPKGTKQQVYDIRSRQCLRYDAAVPAKPDGLESVKELLGFSLFSPVFLFFLI